VINSILSFFNLTAIVILKLKTRGLKMRQIIFIVFISLLFTSVLFSQEDRKVLVEVFTNSHCGLCPAAHNVIDNYLTGPNGDKISYIYYHMVYPYSDDLLYIQSMEDSDARDNYYNPVHATPQGWFDGDHQGSSSGWAASLDNRVSVASPLKIILSGLRNTTEFNINAEVTRTGSITDNDLVIHFVVVEDLYYNGRNSVSNHKHVMRKMFPTPNGQSFSINLNETKNIPQTITLDPLWDSDSLNVVVFIQSEGSKTVYQSETISQSELLATNVNNETQLPETFILEQNYPNPFNPTTKIKYTIPVGTQRAVSVHLKVYDVLGNEIAVLVNEEKSAGTYEVKFDSHSGEGRNLTSGVYFYTLTVGEFFGTKKMILLR
jgi:hypothetical protein